MKTLPIPHDSRSAESALATLLCERDRKLPEDPGNTMMKTPSIIAGAALLACSIACARTPEIRDLNIAGTDYAFLVSDTIPPGQARVTFTNRGKVRHELSLARLRPGVTLRDVMEAQQQGRSPDEFLIGGGVLFAGPGETDPIGLSVDFRQGERYAMVCFFRDSANAPPHVALGMLKEVVVAPRK